MPAVGANVISLLLSINCQILQAGTRCSNTAISTSTQFRNDGLA
jgi:hypothetical protein